MKKLTIVICICVVLAGLNQAYAVDVNPESDEAFQKRMEWFTDAQFGLFIHYGVYSTLGGEWKGKPVPKYAEWIQRWGKITPEEYIPNAANFKPEKLDADLWVKTAKEAGMKYMVITTKHHEGFCLWDSAHTEYDLGEATDFDRDILGELKAACDKYGLKFGTYYSIIDWHHPSQRAKLALNRTPMTDKEGYVKYMKAQLKELIDRYQPAVMWFDGDWTPWWTMDDGKDLYNYLRELDPELIINNRVAKRGQFKKDYGTPENSTPGAALDHVWEACWTVNHSWGFKKSDTKWKSTEVLVQKQIDINTKGGNLLLNVGPHADGSWPRESIKQLKDMGAWNKAHKDAVYGSDYVDLPAQTWGKLSQAKGSTYASGEVFAFVFKWPTSGKILIKSLSADKIDPSTYKGESLPFTVTKAGVEIDVSSAKARSLATVLRIKYDGRSELAKKTTELKLEGNELMLQASDAKLSAKVNRLQNDSYIGFWTDPSDTASWALNVPAPGKFSVKLLYACEKAYSGSDVQMTVSGKKLTAKVDSTAGWEDFQLMDLGVVELNEVGSTTCKVGFGKKKGKALLNLKSVILAPVKTPLEGAADTVKKKIKYLETGGERKLDLLYKQVGKKELHLDLYYPTGNRQKKSPVIVYTHGGGWAAGSKQGAGNASFAVVFKKLTEQGYAVASVNYRLYSKGGSVSMRDCVIDSKDAIRYLSINSKSLGLDPMRFYAMGDSAGGQIAQMLVLASPESLPGDTALASAPYKMIAGVSWYGPCDFEKEGIFNHDDREGFRDRFGPRIMSPDADPADKLALYREMSPVNYLTKDSAPLLMIQGDKDTTIPVKHAYYMQEKAKELKAPVEILIVKNAGHNFRKVDADIKPTRNEIIEATVSFFMKHL